MTAPVEPVDLTIESLAAGGDGVGRDATGRVTFVPRAGPGDRVRVALVKQTKSFARGEIVELLEPGATRVAPPCPHFVAGCGGCQWQHVSREAQLAAKQVIAEAALRKLEVRVHPIDGTTPAFGWRRRARFHVSGGRVGLYAEGSHRVIPIGPTDVGGRLTSCPQLEPGLDAAFAEIAAASPPDGELAFVIGHAGDVVVGVGSPWRVPPRLRGRAGIIGVIANGVVFGTPVVELEPGLVGGPWDFAQASTVGNRALADRAVLALGPPGEGSKLLELHAGSGNLTRAYAAAGWDVVPSDVVAPAQRPPNFVLGKGSEVLRAIDSIKGPFDAIALDPPRTGAVDEIEGVIARAPRVVVYVSCDPATLARDAARLVAGGYKATEAWPLDLMPQTAHVEIVLRLVRA